MNPNYERQLRTTLELMERDLGSISRALTAPLTGALYIEHVDVPRARTQIAVKAAIGLVGRIAAELQAPPRVVSTAWSLQAQLLSYEIALDELDPGRACRGVGIIGNEDELVRINAHLRDLASALARIRETMSGSEQAVIR